MPAPKRKYFFIGGFTIVALVIWVCLSAVAHFNQQIEDIRSGTSLNGGFHPGVIMASIVPNTVAIAVTNLPAGQALPGTVGSGDFGTTVNSTGFNMAFVVHVVNSGRASSAWNWQASFILPNGQTLDASIPSISSISDNVIGTSRGPYRMGMENNLLQTLSFDPLASGAGLTGWFIVHVKGIDAPPVGSHFIITFTDAFNHIAKIDHYWTPPFSTQ